MHFNQSHFIKIMKGAILYGKNMRFGDDFGPVGNTEKKVLGRLWATF